MRWGSGTAAVGAGGAAVAEAYESSIHEAAMAELGGSTLGSEALDLKAMHEYRLLGRQLIVDENIPVAALRPLEEAGFNVKRFAKGTPDEKIIAYAEEGNSIVLTNNFKDFKDTNITALKVTEKQRKNINHLVDLLKALDEKAQANPAVIERGRNVSLANPDLK